MFNGSGKGYLPAGTIGNRTHILSERLKAGTEFKRLKKGHRPAPTPLKRTHILSYKPNRRYTVGEIARIQSFPDSYDFSKIPLQSRYKVIGNAVPPVLGWVIAKALTNKLLEADGE